jgi:hypothetical protein
MPGDRIKLAADQARAFQRSMVSCLRLFGIDVPDDDAAGPEAEDARNEAILAAHQLFALAFAAERREASLEATAPIFGPRLVRDPGVPVDGPHPFPLVAVRTGEEFRDLAVSLLRQVDRGEGEPS